TYFQLISDGKAFVEFVLAFILSLGFQLTHKATCTSGGSLTRHSHYGPPGANDRFFTVRKNSGRISSCLPYRRAFKNKRIREPSPERVGLRWDISSPLCPLAPRFSLLERVDNTFVGANRKFADVCSWRA